MSYVSLILIILSFASVSHAQNTGQRFESEENLSAPKNDSAEESPRPDPQPTLPERNTYPAVLAKFTSGQFISHALVVDKSTRTLSVWRTADDLVQFITAFPVDIGKRPGDKQNLGDQKTPLGVFLVKEKLEGDRLNFDEYGVRAFTTDYPNYFDLLANKTGNGIWLHGIPDSKSLWRGSRGCVVLRNEAVQAVSAFIQPGRTPLIISESVKYLPTNQYKDQQKKWLDWLNTWEQSWESKALDDYMAHYAPNFKALGMDWMAWKSFKKNLNERYQRISVRIIEPSVFIHDKTATIRFLQAYDSDQTSDFGAKTLYVQNQDGKNLILHETWEPLSSDLLAKISK